MPKNSAMGMIVCVSGAFIAFGLVWYMWWLVVVGLLAVVFATIGWGFARDTERIVPALEVEQAHMRWLEIVAATRPVARNQEVEPVNRGLAVRSAMGAAE